MPNLKNIQRDFQKFFTDVNKQVDIVRKNLVTYEEPYSEITQNDKIIEILVKLPDVYKKDLTVKLEGNQVFVNAHQREKSMFGYITKKGFSRKILIPDNALLKKAKAVYKGDILKIKIPKSNSK